MITAPDLLANPAEKQKIYTFNSTLCFVFTYLLVYGLNQLVTLGMARLNHIPAVLFPGHINFKISDNAWRVSDVVSTYGPGPVVCFLAALVSAFVFNRIKHLGGLRKLGFLWFSLHGFNFFLGGLIAGTVARGGFWYAVRWSIPSDAVTWGLCAFAGLLLLLIGFLAAPGFLISCDSITLIQFENRRKLLNALVIWPWLLGSLVIFLLKFPDLTYLDALLHLTLLLMLLPVYFFSLGNPISETVEEPHKTQYALGLGIGLVLLLLVYRVALQNGMHFG